MSKMTATHLGVIVFAIYLSTQLLCTNAVTNTTTNTTTIWTGSSTKINSTTMATNTFSSNSTTPYGRGVSQQSGLFSYLIPVVMATSLLHRSC
ncbi:hypothetical protein DPEC_G00319840 [Dallia pectoralis]|uniref:Uncharacterized protein n=1 Tax=Dallia pectoralis TaxID=75939 RepID=A0ACC2F9N0_DALPE|nr:hypothetical protein DPEC_G00319840 [Dallia pectoralis]